MTERTVQNPMRDAVAASAEVQPPEAEQGGLGLLDLLEVFAPHLRLLLLVPVAVGLLTLAYSYTLHPLFTATARFVPPQQQQGSAAALLQGLGGTLGGLAGAAAGIKSPAEQYVAILRSRTIQDALIARFKLKDREGHLSQEQWRDHLSRATQVTLSKDGLMEVTCTDLQPQFAADLANGYIDELRALLGRMAMTEAQQRRIFFEKHLIEAKDNLVRAEQALQLVGVNPATLRTASPQTALEGVARMTAQVAALEVRLGAMKSYLTESAPEYQQARSELSALRAQLAVANQESSPQSARQGQYIAKYREFKYQETLFELFAKQYELARVDESREGPPLQILDSAIPPELKSWPKRGNMVVTAVVGTFVILLIWVFVSDRMKQSFQDETSQVKLTRLRLAIRRSLGF